MWQKCEMIKLGHVPVVYLMFFPKKPLQNKQTGGFKKQQHEVHKPNTGNKPRNQKFSGEQFMIQPCNWSRRWY